LYPPVLNGSAAASGLSATAAVTAVAHKPTPTAALTVILAKVVIPDRLPCFVLEITSVTIVSSATVELPDAGVHTSSRMDAVLTCE
jgi:hypothetical protein